MFEGIKLFKFLKNIFERLEQSTDEPQEYHESKNNNGNYVSDMESRYGEHDKYKYFNEILIPPREEPEPPFLSACAEKREQNNYVAYFKNGILYDVSPRNKSISLYEDRQIAYDARYIVSDNVKYDLEDADSVSQIKIPHYKPSIEESVTFYLSYILKMRANNEERPWLAVPLVYKAASMTLVSPIGTQRIDYYRLIKHLWLIGEIRYADYLQEELLSLGVLEATQHKKYISDYYDKLSPYYGSDLIESNNEFLVCSECAKYTKRIFSEFGYNKKYPKLPDYFKQHLPEHRFCQISFFPVSDDILIPVWDYNGDLIKFCNRPYKDNRTPEQIRKFEEYKIHRLKKEESDNRYCSREYWIGKYKNKLEYQQIVDIMGEGAPKSLSGYMRMKKSNTKNYQKILKIALDNNITIN